MFGFKTKQAAVTHTQVLLAHAADGLDSISDSLDTIIKPAVERPAPCDSGSGGRPYIIVFDVWDEPGFGA